MRSLVAGSAAPDPPGLPRLPAPLQPQVMAPKQIFRRNGALRQENRLRRVRQESRTVLAAQARAEVQILAPVRLLTAAQILAVLLSPAASRLMVRRSAEQLQVRRAQRKEP